MSQKGDIDMTYKELKKKVKEEQKSLAQTIRNGKTGRKPGNRNDENIADYNCLEGNRDNYRYRHIIYCTMLNNTPYELVEQPRDDNAPSTYYLDKIKKEWENQLDETVCDCA